MSACPFVPTYRRCGDIKHIFLLKKTKMDLAAAAEAAGHDELVNPFFLKFRCAAAANCVRLRCTSTLTLRWKGEKCKQHLPAESFVFIMLFRVCWMSKGPGKWLSLAACLGFFREQRLLGSSFSLRMMMMSLRELMPLGQSRHLNLFWTHLANSIIGLPLALSKLGSGWLGTHVFGD